MGLLEGSMGSGGSVNSAQNASYSVGNGMSNSYSRVYGTEASIRSSREADRANATQKAFMDQAMAYNASEADKQRAFNLLTGSTVYSRSIKDMINAGINPILAASFGLSAANVNSGSAASITTPSAFMGQTFADQESASHSEWSSKSESHGSSSGSGWQNSESGLATGLSLLGNAIGGAIEKINGSSKIDLALNGLDSIFNKDKGNTDKQYSDFVSTTADLLGINKNKAKDTMMTKDSGKYKAMKKSLQKNNPALYKSPQRINEANW